jgi:regulator of replication initiation timing
LNSDTDFDAGNHPDASLIREPEGCFPKSPLRRTDHKKPSYNFGKSVRVMEKLQNNLVIVGEHLPFQSEINSPLQLQETKRLQEELAKKNSDLVKLKKQQDWLLKENKELTKMQNSMAKEVDSLRQQIEKQATKSNHDVANFMEFSFEELKDATNNFDNKFKIGEGGYGGVYKGVLYSTTVAIKIHRGGNQGEREFYQEVNIYAISTHFTILFFFLLSFLLSYMNCLNIF